MKKRFSKKVKRAYLMRLAITMICALVIPFFAIVLFFWNRSTKEIQRSNDAYYEGVLNSFRYSFEEYELSLRKSAKLLYFNSRSAQNILFSAGTQIVEDESLSDSLRVKIQNIQGTDVIVSEVGFVFPQADVVVSKSGYYSMTSFEEKILNTNNPVNKKVWQQYQDGLTFAYPTFVMTPVQEDDGSIKTLFTYRATFGKNDSYPLIIFYLTNQKFFREFLNRNMEEGMTFYILDARTEDILFTYNEESVEQRKKFLENYSAKEKKSDTIFEVENTQEGYKYVMLVTTSSIQTNFLEYQHMTGLFGWIFAILLLLISALALMIQYRPVHLLVSGLDADQDTEFKSIQKALDQRKERIEEQEMVIMDSLLNHLINDVPFPKEQMSWVPNENFCYRVYLLEKASFGHLEQEQLKKQVTAYYPGKIFINDLLGENKFVLILAIQKDFLQAFDYWVRRFLDNLSSEKYELNAGTPVNDLNDIRRSFMSCYQKNKAEQNQMKEDLAAMTNEKQHSRSKGKILQFIDENFTNPNMCQTMVADSLNLSNYTISRLFKSQIGIGFSEYVNKKRLEYAKELLEKEALSISEVSNKVGFENARYFSKIFKETYGVSPSDYKKD